MGKPFYFFLYIWAEGIKCSLSKALPCWVSLQSWALMHDATSARANIPLPTSGDSILTVIKNHWPKLTVSGNTWVWTWNYHSDIPQHTKFSPGTVVELVLEGHRAASTVKLQAGSWPSPGPLSLSCCEQNTRVGILALPASATLNTHLFLNRIFF